MQKRDVFILTAIISFCDSIYIDQYNPLYFYANHQPAVLLFNLSLLFLKSFLYGPQTKDLLF